jgi:L-asparagine transporter-like permease
MPGTEGFLELAAIAGVFVGFGTLIAVRGGGADDPFDVAMMRGVVSMALLTVVAALTPATLARYDPTDHEVWALSSVVALAGLVVILVANVRTPEYRSTPFSRRRVLAGLPVVVLILLAAVLAPVVILLGVAPDIESALYFTAVVSILLLDAWWLLQLTFRGRQPASA